MKNIKYTRSKKIIYKINRNKVIEEIKNYTNFIPDQTVTIYDFYYTDEKNRERKINITIQREIAFDGEKFFTRYQTEIRTYINNDKEDYYYIEYVSYDNEDGKEFDDIRENRSHNIGFIFDEISKFIKR